MSKFRIVECINVIWECEAKDESEAKNKYHIFACDNMAQLLNEGESDIEVTEIDEDGNSI